MNGILPFDSYVWKQIYIHIHFIYNSIFGKIPGYIQGLQIFFKSDMDLQYGTLSNLCMSLLYLKHIF